MLEFTPDDVKGWILFTKKNLQRLNGGAKDTKYSEFY